MPRSRSRSYSRARRRWKAPSRFQALRAIMFAPEVRQAPWRSVQAWIPIYAAALPCKPRK